METTTNRFWATIEFLPGQRAAIIELTTTLGEWAGGGRIEVRPINGDVRGALIEAGYVHASASAAAKGGVLDRFSEFSEPAPAPTPTPTSCGQAASVVQLRRPVNGLNVEHFVNSPVRCRLKMPGHWSGSGRSSLRWLGSGGDATVFGSCTPGNCPKGKA